MVNNTTTLIDCKSNPPKTRDFTFDYSFWSHDGFETLENGYFQPIDEKYADQTKVFELVGKEILDNAWLGYHCCLFAQYQ